MSEVQIDSAHFRHVLGHYPTGVSVITALDTNEQPIGMVVGTFTSVSLDPPLVGFLPDKRSGAWALLEQAKSFCVNILASDQQGLCQQISSRKTDKFADIGYTLTPRNLPALHGAIGHIECDIHQVVDAGDHWFVLGKVLHMDAVRDTNPMIYSRGKYGGFGDIGTPST